MDGDDVSTDQGWTKNDQLQAPEPSRDAIERATDGVVRATGFPREKCRAFVVDVLTEWGQA